MSPETYAAGANQALTANSFTNPGYNFAGWSTTGPSGPEVYYNQDTITVAQSETLTALWTPTTVTTVTVTFNAEGGRCGQSQSGPIGSTITLPAAPTWAGHTFKGWFLSASGGTALVSPYTLTGSLTLYAQWSTNATVTSRSTPKWIDDTEL